MDNYIPSPIEQYENLKREDERNALRRAMVDVMTQHWTIIERKDMYWLVKVALKHEEITISKASELLGLPIEDVRCLLREWEECKKTP